MNNNVISKKIIAFNNIFDSYQTYNGDNDFILDNNLKELKDKLNNEEFLDLLNTFDTYKQYIFYILAKTQRVFVKFNEKEITIDFSDLDNLFFSIEDLDKKEE